MASYNLGATQRNIIRGHEIDEAERRVAEEEVQVELRTRDEFDTKKTKESEEKRYCLPKCFLLGIGLLILLAGMIALIYFFKEHESDSGPRGVVFTTERPSKECEDIVVALGEDVEIVCNMNVDIPGEVHAIHATKVGATEDDFTCYHDNRTVSCKAEQKARCSSYGDVTIRFYDSVYDDKKVQFTRAVTLSGTYTSPVATIEQMENDPTEFLLHCSYTSCTSYDVGFYGRNNINIADSVSCQTTLSDSEGYNVICSATVSSKVIYDFGNGSDLNCHLKNGDKIEETKELVLPACNDIPFHKEACNYSMTTLFECNNIPDVTGSCDKTCLLAKQCFSARVYELPNNTTSSMCPECALKWCREAVTRIIDNTGTIPFKELCDKWLD